VSVPFEFRVAASFEKGNGGTYKNLVTVEVVEDLACYRGLRHYPQHLSLQVESITTHQFHFGEFILDPSRYSLQRGERSVRLEKRPMELLILLVERRGALVSREEIAERLWGKGVFVDVEHGINTAMRKVRTVLRDDSERPRYVETVVGKGYRFAAPVISSSNGQAGSAAPAGSSPEAAAVLSSAPGGAAAVAAARAPHGALFRTWLPVAAASLLSLLIAMGFFLSRRGSATLAARPAIRSVAVLPLKNLSGDSTQEYLADGMTEALISRLSAIQDLRVISRTSIMRFKDTQLSIPEIAKMLGVEAFVEGSVIREGNRIRVIAQLVRADDQHFWSQTYDRDLTDALALQSDITQAIAARVEATIVGREHERFVAPRPVSADAYDSYLKARFALNTKSDKRAGIEESIHYFEQAINKDPKFALAYAGLAAARSELGLVRNGGSPEARQGVIDAARKALELDPNLSEPHVLLADIARMQWNWAESEAEYRKALEVNPSDADAYAGYALWLTCQGRMDEAVNWAERIREIDRLGISGNTLAWVLFNARRYDDAIREERGLMAVLPDDVQVLWTLGFNLIVKGQPEDAIPLLEKASALSDRSSGVIDLLAAAYARGGRRDDALRIVAELHRRQKAVYVPATSFVIAYMGLGDYEQAFVWLDQAYKEKSNILQFVKVHPLLDPLRGDPRFTYLVRRVGVG